MTAKTAHTVDEVRKWFGTAAMSLCLYFLIDMHSDFKELGRDVTNNKSRIEVHEVKIKANQVLTEAQGKRLDKLQNIN